MRRLALTLAFLALPAPLSAGTAPAEEETVADRVLEGLQAGRRDAAIVELVRREDLDRVALERARKIAALPHDRRLTLGESIRTALERAGVVRFRNVSRHVDMVRGYPDPASGFLESWQRYERGWAKAMDPRFDSIGIASHAAGDGWVVLVAVLLEELPARVDPHDAERRTVRAVNEIRAGRGLPALRENASLADIARAHSGDMARHDYFDHVSRDGGRVGDRVRARGIGYRAIAENLHRNRGREDPVAAAVESWMGSRPHRRNILGPAFRETGVGVVRDDRGFLYFTQLFLTPPSDAPAGTSTTPAPDGAPGGTPR